MSTLFARFNIMQISVINLLIFCVLVALLVTYVIDDNIERYRHASQDEQTVELVFALEQLVHQHALEQGLTEGYYGSPNSSAKSTLDRQRSNADDSVANFKSLFMQEWPESFQLSKAMGAIQTQFRQKPDVRRQVDDLSADDAFTFYSTLNRLALDTASFTTLNIHSKEVRDLVKLTITLAQLKERMGQIRATITRILATKQLTPAAQAEVKTFLSDKIILTDTLHQWLKSDQRRELMSTFDSSNSRQIDKIIITIITETTLNYNNLPDAQAWFELASEQIEQVNEVLETKSAMAMQLSSAQASAASNWLYGVIVAVAVVISIIATLNIYLVRTLRRELYELTHILTRVAQSGDLTLDVRLQSEDELGRISQAIHTMLNAFKDLIVGLAESIETNRRLNTGMKTTSDQVRSFSDQSQTMAANIASSIAQMAATSEEISASAASTMGACTELRHSVAESAKTNHQTQAAMETLTGNMSKVEQHAADMENQLTDIGGMLETINNVAEQTNLLALNAAIEAARAGEQGRGFAVVADEVRALAKGSKESAEKISTLLHELSAVSQTMISSIRVNVKTAHETHDRSKDAGKIVEDLSSQAEQVEMMTTSVSAAAEQQSVVAKQIQQDSSTVLNAAEEEHLALAELNKLQHDLEVNSQTLERTMDGFKFN